MPRCRFLQNLPCGNVPRDPVGASSDAYLPPHQYTFSARPLLRSSTMPLHRMNVNRPSGAMHPKYITYAARLESFKTWRKSKNQPPEEMADAGFFYTGEGDKTRCFHCGGGLQCWKIGAKPWEQHARWFKVCYYLWAVKGQAYIDSIPQIDEPKESTWDGPVTTEGIILNSETMTAELETPITIELAKVPDSKICKICFLYELEIVFLPCGHMLACARCASGLRDCAVCRKRITLSVNAIIC